MNKSYEEMLQYNSYEDRLSYLMCYNKIGIDIFGYNRYLNQKFYTSNAWKQVRNEIIIRDDGYDLGIKDDTYKIVGPIYIHHINPITIDDIINNKYILTDPNNLISVSRYTHDSIHYRKDPINKYQFICRSKNDTKLW